jgi:DNA-binding GntR family transcriptional regulator
VTTVDKLAEDLAETILSGEFAPGYRLDEQALAQRYSVSRTPVREALRQLATTGLIEIRPRRSAIVAKVSPAQLEELFVAMGELEAGCARLAAMSMTLSERRALQTLHDEMRLIAERGDPFAFCSIRWSTRARTTQSWPRTPRRSDGASPPSAAPSSMSRGACSARMPSMRS